MNSGARLRLTSPRYVTSASSMHLRMLQAKCCMRLRNRRRIASRNRCTFHSPRMILADPQPISHRIAKSIPHLHKRFSHDRSALRRTGAKRDAER